MNRKRDKNMDIKEKINAFLYFSYLPPPITATSRYINLIEENTNPATKNNYATMSTQQLLKIGSDSFNSAIEERILNNKTNIVPLSGGLDSRAILAALIENGLKDEVITVTFGTPGTYDYEIGPYIAKIIGVKNEPIDLTSVRLEETDLISTASELENWTRVFEAHYNQLICKKYGKNVVYWSGVMAGPTTGSNLLAADSSLWEEAVQSFICRNRYAKKDV